MRYLFILISLAIFGLLIYFYFERFVGTTSSGVEYSEINRRLETTQETVDKYNETTKDYEEELRGSLNIE